MGELERKDGAKQAAEQAELKRQNELSTEEPAHAKAKSQNQDEQPLESPVAIPWSIPVERFFNRLDRVLHDLRISMTSSEFRDTVHYYRERSAMEKRAIANKLQRRGLHALLRAIHGGDYRTYTDTWQAEAEAVRDGKTSTHSDEP